MTLLNIIGNYMQYTVSALTLLLAHHMKSLAGTLNMSDAGKEIGTVTVRCKVSGVPTFQAAGVNGAVSDTAI